MEIELRKVDMEAAGVAAGAIMFLLLMIIFGFPFLIDKDFVGCFWALVYSFAGAVGFGFCTFFILGVMHSYRQEKDKKD